MTYQALYRVWRPQRFEDLIGQDLVTQTLKNALKTKQTTHAYLFCGPRGTGKTSAAKIFAKALNCPNQTDGEPCNECETCKAITAGRLGDVIEIDAASNNGVEEIRDIRDKAKYAPTVATYKVYIIDEVHMLSNGAFNALLKTLEEPPQNVVFILATTEPHKIPATIISRTQRFDFKRIDAKVILKRLEYILTETKHDYDDEALKVIAKAADGGMRDALSILDQVISFGDDGEVTLKNARIVTGTASKDQLHEYMRQVAAHDVTKALETATGLLSEGLDAGRLVEDLINYCRDLMVYQQAPDLVEAEELGQLDPQFAELAQAFSQDQLAAFIEILNQQQQNMRYSMHPTVYVEVLTVKMAAWTGATTAPASTATPAVNQPAPVQAPVQPVPAQPAADAGAASQEVADLKQRVVSLADQVATLTAQLKQATLTGTGAAPVQPAPKPKKKARGNQDYDLKITQIYAILAAAKRQALVQLKEVWPDLLSMLSVPQRAVLRFSQPVAASADGVVLSIQYSFLCAKAMDDEELVATLKQDINRLTGNEYKLAFVASEDWAKVRADFLATHKVKGKQGGSESSASASLPDQADQADQADNADQAAPVEQPVETPAAKATETPAEAPAAQPDGAQPPTGGAEPGDEPGVAPGPEQDAAAGQAPVPAADSAPAPTGANLVDPSEGLVPPPDPGDDAGAAFDAGPAPAPSQAGGENADPVEMAKQLFGADAVDVKDD